MLSYQWEKKFKYAVEKYNRIYKEELPRITPHICRHTYCTNMAKTGISAKTLQYLMGHSYIGITMNVYTHLKLEDARNELDRINAAESARKEMQLAAMESARGELLKVSGKERGFFLPAKISRDMLRYTKIRAEGKMPEALGNTRKNEVIPRYAGKNKNLILLPRQELLFRIKSLKSS